MKVQSTGGAELVRRAESPALLVKDGLIHGRILRRYKRFLADIELDDGSVVTAHTTNTGTMATCWEPRDPVLIEPNDNPKRKLRYTWIACLRAGTWVGVETGVPNRIVAEAARRGVLPGLPGLGDVRTEVRYGREKSRIDVLAADTGGREVYIEVKNTTLRVESDAGPLACFPDAVTTRGAKHLRELQAVVHEGNRAAIVFFVHRGDAVAFDVARHIDAAYADEFDRAVEAGVEVLPLAVDLRVAEEGSGRANTAWSLSGLLPRCS